MRMLQFKNIDSQMFSVERYTEENGIVVFQGARSALGSLRRA
jgi:hypothetical protein